MSASSSSSYASLNAALSLLVQEGVDCWTALNSFMSAAASLETSGELVNALGSHPPSVPALVSYLLCCEALGWIARGDPGTADVVLHRWHSLLSVGEDGSEGMQAALAPLAAVCQHCLRHHYSTAFAFFHKLRSRWQGEAPPSHPGVLAALRVAEIAIVCRAWASHSTLYASRPAAELRKEVNSQLGVTEQELEACLRAAPPVAGAAASPLPVSYFIDAAVSVRRA